MSDRLFLDCRQQRRKKTAATAKASEEAAAAAIVAKDAAAAKAVEAAVADSGAETAAAKTADVAAAAANAAMDSAAVGPAEAVAATSGEETAAPMAAEEAAAAANMARDAAALKEAEAVAAASGEESAAAKAAEDAEAAADVLQESAGPAAERVDTAADEDKPRRSLAQWARSPNNWSCSTAEPLPVDRLEEVVVESEGDSKSEVGDDVTEKQELQATHIKGLRNRCKYLGISAKGGKMALIDRILAHGRDQQPEEALSPGPAQAVAEGEDDADAAFGPSEKFETLLECMGFDSSEIGLLLSRRGLAELIADLESMGVDDKNPRCLVAKAWLHLRPEGKGDG